jgi:RNA polymerase sigma factor (sigma-70 family)
MAKEGSQSHWRSIEALFDSGALGGLTDGELLECFENRRDSVGHEAFRLLVERHGAMVLGLCRTLVRDAHEAEDAFQGTFLVLVLKAGTIKRRHTIGPWLHGVAARVARRARDRSARRQRREVAAGSEIPALERPLVDSKSSEAAVQEEIARLPDRFRDPIVLCCLEGMSYELAARRLGVSEPTVRGRLYRARTQLAARLRHRGITMSVCSSPVNLTGFTLPNLPPALVGSTVELSTRWSSVASLLPSAGEPVAANTLAEGVIRAMQLSSLKMWSLIVLMVGGTVGTVVVAQQGRNAAASVPPQAPANPGRTEEKPAERRPVTTLQILEKLKKPIDAEFPQGITLEQLLKLIKQQSTDAEFPGIPIYVSPLGLQDVNASMTSKVVINVKQKPIHDILNALIPMQLTTSVRDGFLMIDSVNGYRMTEIEQRVLQIDEKVDRVLRALERLEKAK